LAGQKKKEARKEAKEKKNNSIKNFIKNSNSIKNSTKNLKSLMLIELASEEKDEEIWRLRTKKRKGDNFFSLSLSLEILTKAESISYETYILKELNKEGGEAQGKKKRI